jgi:hypothetical protein
VHIRGNESYELLVAIARGNGKKLDVPIRWVWITNLNKFNKLPKDEGNKVPEPSSAKTL